MLSTRFRRLASPRPVLLTGPGALSGLVPRPTGAVDTGAVDAGALDTRGVDTGAGGFLAALGGTKTEVLLSDAGILRAIGVPGAACTFRASVRAGALFAPSPPDTTPHTASNVTGSPGAVS